MDWFDNVFGRRGRWRPKRRRMLADFEDLDTQQRTLEAVVQEYTGKKPDVGGILSHLLDRGWDAQDVIHSISSLEKFLLVEGSVPPSHAMDLLHNAIFYGSLRQESYYNSDSPFQQLALVVEAVGLLVKSDAPSWVYTDVLGTWHGNRDKDARKNSTRFARDVRKAVDGLIYTPKYTRRAKNLLLRCNEKLINSSSLSYGPAISALSYAFGEAKSDTPAQVYELCNRFFEVDKLTELPGMYYSLLRLPADTPSSAFNFIEHVMGFLSQNKHGDGNYAGLRNLGLAEQLRAFVFRLSTALGLAGTGGYDFTPKDVGEILRTGFTEDQASAFIRGYDEIITVLLENERRRIDIKISDVKNLIPKLQEAIFNTELYILEVKKRLKGNARAAEYFDLLLEPLRSAISPYGPLELMVFAECHMKQFENTPLVPFEQRLYDELVFYSFRESTKKRDDRNRIRAIIQDSRNMKPTPPHVMQYYWDVHGIKLNPLMLDIGTDNDAWYRWTESAKGYMSENREDLADKRVDREFLQAVVSKLVSDQSLVRQSEISVHGLACGDAWPELILSEELQECCMNSPGGPKNFDVRLYLFDINDTMLTRAAKNCNRMMIPASVRRKDIRKISYADVDAMDRQLVITMFGRTYFNLETESDRLLKSLRNVCREHYDRGCTSPTILLIEGSEEPNMEYYWSEGAEGMHVQYFLKRLKARKASICYDPSSTLRMNAPPTAGRERAVSTYAAIQTPNKDRVEFYIATLEPTRILDDCQVGDNQLIRCGESRIVSPQLLDSFRSLSFNYQLVKRHPDDKKVMIVLVPDYDNLF